MTHDDMTRRAEKWLLNKIRCNFVLRELASVGLEIPDAIGWRDGLASYLVECKISRADFLADSKKHFRQRPATGMGKYRYMMCPKDMIKPEEVPDKWGLLYCLPAMVRVIKEAEHQDNHQGAEICLMTSALRRVHLRGDLAKIYDYSTLRGARQASSAELSGTPQGGESYLCASCGQLPVPHKGDICPGCGEIWGGGES